jgi:hypothetical protein
LYAGSIRFPPPDPGFSRLEGRSLRKNCWISKIFRGRPSKESRRNSEKRLTKPGAKARHTPRSRGGWNPGHEHGRGGTDMEPNRQLEDEGVEKFVQPYDALMKSIEKKRG